MGRDRLQDGPCIHAIRTDDDVYKPQEALTASIRTDTWTSTTDPTPTRMQAHMRSRYTTGPAIQGLNLRREGLGGGYVGQRLRHMARPAGIGRHARVGKDFPHNILPVPKHHQLMQGVLRTTYIITPWLMFKPFSAKKGDDPPADKPFASRLRSRCRLRCCIHCC